MEPSLKVNAIYFPGDRFIVDSPDRQVSYHALGAILMKAHVMGNRALFSALVKSCMNKISLEDTDIASDILEAHIFEKLSFQGHMKEFHLSLDHNDVRPEDLTDIDQGERLRDMQTIKRNARTFCDKWGI